MLSKLWTKQSKYVVEIVTLIMLLITAFHIASNYLEDMERQGQRSAFYQNYFEPAVMMACGHGYVQSKTPIVKLQDFVSLKTDSFSCNQLPGNILQKKISSVWAYWYYLMFVTSITWKLLGISWTAINKLISLFFGVTIVISYGIFRLGMGRLFSIVCAMLFATSAGHLSSLLLFHDYVKAPFILAIIFMLGLLVVKPFKIRALLVLSILIGVVLGIGWSFRQDSLITLPVICLTILFFLPNKGWQHFFRNICLIGVVIVSASISLIPFFNILNQSHAEQMNGSFMPHVMELGLSNSFTQELKITPSIYDFLPMYLDTMSYAVGLSYGERELHSKPLWGTKEYDKALSLVYLTTLKIFPADFLVRAYSSILILLKTPFDSPYDKAWNNYVPGGIFLTISLLVGVAVFNIRIATFMCFLILYFLAYPAIQFNARHYFHLSFWNLWALGFIVWHIIKSLNFLVFNTDCGREKFKQFFQSIMLFRSSNPLLMTAGFILGMTVLLMMPLYLFRAYQTNNVLKLVKAYKDTAIQPLAYSEKAGEKTVSYKIQWPASVHGMENSQFYSKMLYLSFGGNQCMTAGVEPKIVYSREDSIADFTTTINLQLSGKKKYGEIYMPIYFYETFGHVVDIVLPIEQKNCLQTIGIVKTKSFYPLWLTLKLPEDWEKQKLYQQINSY